MLTILIFLVVLSVLVFAHELGHFWVAKRAGMKVEEFGFGFPPRIFGVKRRETVYSVNWIPFGGFVKIFGEAGEHADNPRSFAAARAGVRARVIVAGVVMNLILAVVLLSISNGIGLRVGLVDEQSIKQAKDIKVQIAAVAADSPAQQAGLRVLDEIVGVSDLDLKIKFDDIAAVQNYINTHRGRQIALVIRRGNGISEIPVTPRVNPPPGEGALGIALVSTGIIKYPWHQAIYKGFESSLAVLKSTVVGYSQVIKNLIINGKAGTELSGPVGIAVITGQAARLGLTYLIQLVALLSINLAVLNIIPFPALDGGRLLFVGIEKIKGSPVRKEIEAAVNAIGFALLILLMVYVTTKDIVKFF